MCHDQSPESPYFYGWPKPSPNGRYMALCLRDVGAKTRVRPLLVQVEKRRVSSRTFGSLPGVDWTCQDIKLQWNYTGISHLWLLDVTSISMYFLICANMMISNHFMSQIETGNIWETSGTPSAPFQRTFGHGSQLWSLSLTAWRCHETTSHMGFFWRSAQLWIDWLTLNVHEISTLMDD